MTNPRGWKPEERIAIERFAELAGCSIVEERDAPDAVLYSDTLGRFFLEAVRLNYNIEQKHIEPRALDIENQFKAKSDQWDGFRGCTVRLSWVRDSRGREQLPAKAGVGEFLDELCDCINESCKEVFSKSANPRQGILEIRFDETQSPVQNRRGYWYFFHGASSCRYQNLKEYIKKVRVLFGARSSTSLIAFGGGHIGSSNRRISEIIKQKQGKLQSYADAVQLKVSCLLIYSVVDLPSSQFFDMPCIEDISVSDENNFSKIYLLNSRGSHDDSAELHCLR